MSKTPSLISGCNGRPEAYQASRQVACCRCEAKILKDENAVKIPTKKGAYLSKKIYCVDCFAAIIKQTKNDINELETLIVQSCMT